MQSDGSGPAIVARSLSRTFKGGIEAVRGVDLSGVILVMGVVLIGLSQRAIATYDK